MITFQFISLFFVLPLLAMSQSIQIPTSAKETTPIPKGSEIPNVILTESDGSKTDLFAIVKNKPAVLIFYRGGWCPYCNLQLQNLRTIDSALIARGYQIIAISPDLPTELQRSIEKHALSYRLFSDSKMTAAKSFGIAFTLDDGTVERYKKHNMDIESSSGEMHHALPVPSVFIIGVDRIIKYVYSNPDYKVRMDVDEILQTITSFQ